MSGFERHADIVALLLIAGADPNKINQYGRKAWQDSRGDANRVYTAFKHRGTLPTQPMGTLTSARGAILMVFD